MSIVDYLAIVALVGFVLAVWLATLDSFVSPREYDSATLVLRSMLGRTRRLRWEVFRTPAKKTVILGRDAVILTFHHPEFLSNNNRLVLLTTEKHRELRILIEGRLGLN